jgi:predicted nuclease with TOPRIM domain
VKSVEKILHLYVITKDILIEKHHVLKKNTINKKKEERMCPYCTEEYARLYTLKIHMQKCKKKPSETEELKQIIAKLNEKMDKQYDELKDMKSKMSNPVINNTINLQQNITITPYGKEDLTLRKVVIQFLKLLD